jgi:hypothetical protein
VSHRRPDDIEEMTGHENDGQLRPHQVTLAEVEAIEIRYMEVKEQAVHPYPPSTHLGTDSRGFVTNLVIMTAMPPTHQCLRLLSPSRTEQKAERLHAMRV